MEDKSVSIKDITVNQIEEVLRRKIAEITRSEGNSVYISSFYYDGFFDAKVVVEINNSSW